MNPFDLAGPEFLAFWIAGCVATTVVVLLVRVHVARDRTRDPHDVVLGTLHPTEAAYLVGGITRAIEAAVAGLHHEGRVAIDDAGLVTRTGKAGPLTIAPDGVFRGVVVDGELPRVESYVMQHLPASVRELVAGAEHVDFVLRQKLQEKGLLVAHETASHWMRAPAIAWLVVGVAKIAIGVSRVRPVAILAFLVCVAAFAITRIRAPRLTTGGRAIRGLLEWRYRALETTARAAPQQLDAAEMTLAYGVFGYAVAPLALVAAMPSYQAAILASAPAAASDGATVATTCSSSCGGGGDGGGGCGGCS